MKHPVYKRILSAVLAVVLFLSCLPGSIFAGEGTLEFYVTCGGSRVKDITFAQNEKPVLTAAGLPEGAEYQWQIKMPGEDTWIKILGQTEPELSVSYALMASIMESDMTTAVRCVATAGVLKYTTDPVKLHLNFLSDAQLMALAEEEAQEETTEATEETAAETTEATEETVEETTEATEETVEETTEATEETVEETTEATEETVEETTEVTEETVEETTEATEETAEATIEATEETAAQETLGSAAVDVLAQMLSFAAVEASAAEMEYVKIEIKYVYEDGTKAFDSYLAYLEPGTDFSAQINSPVKLGYGAFHSGSTAENPDAVTVAVNYTSVTEDQTITVVYKKVPVQYTVRYFLQNINNDLYTEDGSLYTVGKGLEGSYPKTAIEIEIPGFAPLYHQPANIAADGSTRFEVRYDRNYYLINFKLEGGYGIEPVYARYETPFVVGTPVKTGYVFVGWDGNGDGVSDKNNPADQLPSTIPAENRVYTAVWKKVETKYTIVYWRADLDDGNPATPVTYSYWGQTTAEAESATQLTPSAVGTTHTASAAGLPEAGYFAYDAAVTAEKNDDNQTIIVEGDGSTVVNVYYSRKIFEIRFIYARSYRSGGNTVYQVADTTGDGSVGGWGTANVQALPTVKAASGFVSKSEVIRQSNTNYTYYYISLRAEFGADIEAQWPGDAINDVRDSNNRQRRFGSWAAEDGTPYRNEDEEHANIVGPYPYMSAEMVKTGNENTAYTDPQTGETYYIAQRMSAWWGTEAGLSFGGWAHGPIDKHAYHIYYESLDGTYDRIYNGKQYKLVATHEFNCAHNGSTRVDPFFYTGFQCVNDTRDSGLNSARDYQKDSKNYAKGKTYYSCPDNSCAYCNCFYYDRESYKLSFFNYNAESDHPADVTMKYQQPLSEQRPDPITPAYPAGLEPDAYEFKGWYTTAEFYEGTEVDWENGTMPDGHLTLYAKWVPKTRTVWFYEDYTAMLEGNPYDAPASVTVPHASVIPTGTVKDPHRDDYTWLGWFYMEGGAKKAFSVNEMEVREDRQLFAEWVSSEYTQYTIRYVDKNGKELAQPTEGFAFAGLTKTFSAKPSSELYEEYRQITGGMMWLPNTSSHSMLLEPYPEGWVPGQEINVYTFVYDYVTIPPYTVRYVDAVTGAQLLPSVTVKDHGAAVVTEQFQYIEGYFPDAANKRLVLSANKEENVITFSYTKQPDGTPEKVYYLVTHYTQDMDENGKPLNTYSEYTSYEKIAEFGDTVTASPISISGFEHTRINGMTIQSAKLEKPASGTEYQMVELRLYYNRKTYSYQVNYLDYTSHQELSPQKTVTGKYYASSVTEEAIEIAGHQIVGTDSFTIQISDKEEANVINFYYQERKTDIHYRPICLEGDVKLAGHVSPSDENQVIRANIQGSNAVAYDGFEFVGWYLDEACTMSAPEDWITGSRIKPNPDEGQELAESYTYYARFKPISQNLTITKDGAVINTESFLFRITGTNVVDQQVDMIVSIQGNRSVTVKGLYCGTYTVTELTGWSWAYADGVAAQNTTLSVGSDGTITFTNTYENPDWLHGEASKENQFQSLK